MEIYKPLYIRARRGVAQMVARVVRDHEAASSNLVTPTITFGSINRLGLIESLNIPNRLRTIVSYSIRQA